MAPDQNTESSQKKQAQIAALRLLAATPKSRQSLEKKLLEKGYAPAIVRQTLDGLEAQGLLSDRNLAENIAGRFMHSQPSGARRISFEMKRRGIPAPIRNEIIENLNPAEEISRAREAVGGRWQRLAKLDPEKRRKRICDFLIRRGFDFNIAKDVLQELERKIPDES
jgi:regulatory protein